MSSSRDSFKETKAKFPLLGTTPPQIEHCAGDQLLSGGNGHMLWWDCSKCFHRVMDISLRKAEETRYYAVPPCLVSPNYNPSVPTPTLKVKKEVRTPTPPLNAAQYRQQGRTTASYTQEENLILKEARKILQQKGQDLTGFPTLNPVVTASNLGAAGAAASGSQGPTNVPAPLTVPVPPGNTVNKRAGPALFQFGQGPTATKAEDETAGYTAADPTLDAMNDEQVLEELRKLEELTNMLKLTLQNRALQPK